MIIPNIWNRKKCSKPPTSNISGFAMFYSPILSPKQLKAKKTERRWAAQTSDASHSAAAAPCSTAVPP